MNNSLIDLVAPKSGSTIMICDVHASESGALSILDDLYNQIRTYEDKTVNWVFVVSVPEYEETENIKVRRFPWVKKSWGHRYYFDSVTTKSLLKEYNPDKVFSLQNKGISFYKKEQVVYLHLAFMLADYKFDFRRDGIKLWLYQNVIGKSIFKSLKKVDKTIVQTQWMKDALANQAGINKDSIVVQHPDITSNNILHFNDTKESRKRFFYPATAFLYKNHQAILEAVVLARENGLEDYEIIFTIEENENDYTRSLAEYAKQNGLNVDFHGKFPREKVFELYAQSVLIFPSHVETFGLPLLEARMTGTYVIASDCPFSREILEGYEKASYFNAYNSEELSQQILKICNSDL